MEQELIDSFYKIIEVTNKNVTIHLCDKNHPIFQAHFPQNPILPGFMHLEIISRLFNLQIVSIKKAKFTGIVHPLNILVYKRNDNKFKVFCDDKEVASFFL